MSGAPTPSGRPTLHYSVERLSPRDTLLLKSLVKLLDHRTDQHWCCDPLQARLRVRGDETGPAAVGGDSREAAGPTPVLMLAHVEQSHEYFLKQPLHAQALETMLNQLGQKILQMGGAPAALPARTLRTEDPYRLLRWPPAGFLGTPARMRLATLMASQPLSLAGLQQRSGQPAGECAEFFHALVQAGLLQAAPAADAGRTRAAPAAPAPASLGLLARIRSRLGLQFPGTA
jgi:hypothetical protein